MTDGVLPLAEADATAVDPSKTVPPASEALEAAEAEAAPQTTEATEQNGEQPRDPATGRFSRRAEQLTRQVNELTATKHNLRRQIETMQQKAAALQKQLQTPQNFDQLPYEQQQAHLVSHAIKQNRLDEVSQDAEELARESVAVIGAVYRTKIEAARERLQGIDQAAQYVSSLPLSLNACDVIAESDRAAEITHWMAQATNQAEVSRILRLSPDRQAVEIARIEGRLSQPQPIRRISKAPAPVQTVSGNAGSTGVDLNTADMETYMRVRMGG